MQDSSEKHIHRDDLTVHIFPDALRSNIETLRGLCADNTKFCAVVKANAYGHGAREVVSCLVKERVDFFAVASFYQAIHIDSLVGDIPILIFAPLNTHTGAEEILCCADKGYHSTISNLDAAKYIAQILAQANKKLNLHVNVNTGMGRAAISADQAGELVEFIDSCPVLNLAGVFTHFATSDEEDMSFAYSQLDIFNKFLAQNNLINRNDVIIHAANSGATIKMPEAHFDMVRCGIAMYGYFDDANIELIPAVRVEAPIVSIHSVDKGQNISYGKTFTTQRPTKKAVIFYGYADGYLRSNSNISSVKINGEFAPVIGRVCMDQIVVDITDIAQVEVGDMATIIDNDHNSLASVKSLAKNNNTITYEILTSISQQAHRELKVSDTFKYRSANAHP